MAGTVGEFLRVIDLAGVFGNAVLGGIVARELRMDPVGFVALAIMSGLGGGIIRDTLLQHGPPIALTDYLYAITAGAGAIVAFLAPVHGRIWSLVFPVVDALALGCWAAAGAQKTLDVGLGWLAAVLLGTITAVGGGALRDLTVRRIPQIFGGNTLYATCAVAASLTVVLFTYTGNASTGTVVATCVGAALCLLARWRGWQLWQGLEWDYAFQRSRGKRFPTIRVRVNRTPAPPQHPPAE
ncbi:trimeric intracellular cation channel family protein [Mycobacterium shinjukuense]|uniref:Uncharacterized protein n=1 Tax=Mycobacterium shinjukuense TaxID=398694 RepID=A0A7I7MNJ3_9MYCO|nr:trimeric intracellular cation channel family protein [Mycobacterium shinjukuense]MCV6985826.1 trimeric intracellular cation channel family protein [Mycobacterium shinjukuense]ORB71771.1 hypothetical protein BST45_01950 [Mycobacterium shinjukuense]BBX73706.1 hypothetical protein MSHI_16120 [Mycobacterium shinjukuense]